MQADDSSAAGQIPTLNPGETLDDANVMARLNKTFDTNMFNRNMNAIDKSRLKTWWSNLLIIIGTLVHMHKEDVSTEADERKKEVAAVKAQLTELNNTYEELSKRTTELAALAERVDSGDDGDSVASAESDDAQLIEVNKQKIEEAKVSLSRVTDRITAMEKNLSDTLKKAAGSENKNKILLAALKKLQEPRAGGAEENEDELAETDLDEDPPQKSDYIYAKGSVSEGAYINPLLGMSALFSHAEIIIHGNDLPQPMQHNAVYQCLNRAFTTKEIRKLYTGSSDEPLPTKDYLDDAVFQRAAKLLDSGGSEYTHRQGFRISMDGVFLLGAPKSLSVLSVLEKSSASRTDEKLRWPPLRPDTPVICRLHKQRPRGKLFGNLLSLQNGVYMKKSGTLHTTPEGFIVKHPKYGYLEVKPEIVDIKLVLEKRDYIRRQSDHTPSKTERVKLSSQIFPDRMVYTRDVFKTLVSALNSGERRTINSFTLPEKTKICYIIFPKFWQIFWTESLSKASEMAWSFPEGCEMINIKINGNPYKYDYGLRDLTNSESEKRPKDALLYYHDLANLGLIDNDFEDIFPPEGVMPWKQVLALSFLEDEVTNGPATLEVEMLFNGAKLSPTDRQVMALFTVEEDIVDSGNGRWHSSFRKK